MGTIEKALFGAAAVGLAIGGLLFYRSTKPDRGGKPKTNGLGHDWPYVALDPSACEEMTTLKQFEDANPEAYRELGEALDELISLACAIGDESVRVQPLWHYQSYVRKRTVAGKLMELSRSAKDYMRASYSREVERDPCSQGRRPYDPIYRSAKTEEEERGERAVMKRIELGPTCERLWTIAKDYHHNNVVTLATRGRRFGGHGESSDGPDGAVYYPVREEDYAGIH